MLIGSKELKITLASFGDAMRLQRAVGKAIKSTELNVDEKVLNMEVSENVLTTIINAVLSVAISEEVENALFDCCKSVLHGQDVVNRDFFEIESNREYFYPIMIEVGKANLKPFLKGLSSLSSMLQNLQKGIQK